jgi:hypothetical protein
MKTPASSWPLVPKDQQPKPLYLAEVLEPADEELLRDRGWRPMDVRLLAGKTLPERQARCLAWFEGLMAGSIDKAASNLAILELEAKACGLTSLKELPKEEDDGKLKEETIDEILGQVTSRRGNLSLQNKKQEKKRELSAKEEQDAD